MAQIVFGIIIAVVVLWFISLVLVVALELTERR